MRGEKRPMTNRSRESTPSSRRKRARSNLLPLFFSRVRACVKRQAYRVNQRLAGRVERCSLRCVRRDSSVKTKHFVFSFRSVRQLCTHISLSPLSLCSSRESFERAKEAALFLSRPLATRPQRSLLPRGSRALSSLARLEHLGWPDEGEDRGAFQPLFFPPSEQAMADEMTVDPPAATAAGAETATAAAAAAALDEGPPASYHYLVSAHRPTAVTAAAVGAFTGPHDVNLVVS